MATPTGQPGRNYADRDLKLLWGLSAARCNEPTCRRSLVATATPSDRAAVLGKVAHIYPHSDHPSAPRQNALFGRENLNKYENLLLLCGVHHDAVDTQPGAFPVPKLLKWKQDHEAWVAGKLTDAVANLQFPELEMVVAAWLAGPIAPTENFTVTAPVEKMRKNGLTAGVHNHMVIATAGAHEVELFLRHMITLNQTYPEKLRAGFLAKYQTELADGVHGDDLFHSLWSFSCGNSSDFSRRAAGLAVLGYLFITCEVFEP